MIMNNPEAPEMMIPKWFTILAAGLMALAVPWGAWVTMTLATISVRIENQTMLRMRMDKLEIRFTEHLTDPNLHHAKLSQIEARLKLIEDRRENKDGG